MLTVPAEIIKKTTRCRNNFSCLETSQCGDRPMCDVETTHGEHVLCISAADWRNCAYRMDFGGAKFCVCPVRCAIYRQQRR